MSDTKDNSGALFKNERKESDTHADYRGECRIDGHDMWVNAWINKSKDGKTYMKLGFKAKDGTAARPARDGFGSTSVSKTLDGDDIPFIMEFR